jgi:tRNA A37 threonylcarbamoyladenosine modification protein TsaB
VETKIDQSENKEELIIYVAGKINGDANYRAKFMKAQRKLEERGYIVLNPAELPEGMHYEKYMVIGFSMIEVAHAIYMLDDYKDSPGAIRELEHAKKHNKMIIGE